MLSTDATHAWKWNPRLWGFTRITLTFSKGYMIVWVVGPYRRVTTRWTDGG